MKKCYYTSRQFVCFVSRIGWKSMLTPLKLERTLMTLYPKPQFLHISELKPSQSAVFPGRREPSELPKSLATSLLSDIYVAFVWKRTIMLSGRNNLTPDSLSYHWMVLGNTT